MRIITGELGGRQFDAPKGVTTHPMSERVRGALFNVLGDISGLTVLDAFAGSGALSFEALSRGAASAVAVEKDKKAHAALERNIEALGLEKSVKAIRANVASWSEHNPEAKFDLVLCDPPYNDVKLSTITPLVRHLKPKSLMVLSYPGSVSVPAVNGVVVVDNRSYTDAALAFFRQKS